MNHITGPYAGIIDGKRTGLAGCADSHMCASADTCIRADARLSHRAHMAAGSTVRVRSCSVYIPIACAVGVRRVPGADLSPSERASLL